MTKEKKDSLFRMALFGVAVVGMAVYLISGALTPPQVPDEHTNSYSTSPGGHSALIEILRNNNREVNISIDPLPDINSGMTWGKSTIALLEPSLRKSKEFSVEFEEMMKLARKEDVRIILALPKRRYESKQVDGKILELEESYHGFVVVDALFQMTPVADYATLHRDDEGQKLGRFDFETKSFETEIKKPCQYFKLHEEDNYNIEVLLLNEDGNPVALRYHPQGVESYTTGGLIVLADPDIISNRFIDQDGAADLDLFLFERLNQSGDIYVDESSHGFASDANIPYLALTTPGLWVTLAIMMALCVWAWRQSTVLRTLEFEAPSRGNRKFAIEALGRMMLRARDHGMALFQLRKRGKMVLSGSRTSVRRAGMAGNAPDNNTETREIDRRAGQSSEQALIDAANHVSRQLLTGEREHNTSEDQS